VSQERKRDVRQELLDAATEEFARYGLDGARMHLIVERAGVNERMIYHHFGSKVGLYEAVLAHHFTAPDRPAPSAGKDAPDERFAATLTAFVHALLARPLFLNLILHEAMAGWKHVPKASLLDIPDSVRSAFEAARRDGSIRKDCRFEVVYLAAMGALVTGRLLASRFNDLRSEKAREALTKDMLDLILRGAMP
jgi:AcrR family transcriptional regulator